jgi:hypothetical protein
LPDNNYLTHDDGIDDPAPLNAIKWDDLEGRLILITPYYTKDVKSLDGDAMREVTFGRVVALDGPGAPLEWDDTPVYPRYLIGQQRPNVGSGRSNLGRVGKDAERKRPGQSAPWVLGKFTDADRQLARSYLTTHPVVIPERSTGGGSGGGNTTLHGPGGATNTGAGHGITDAPPF